MNGTQSSNASEIVQEINSPLSVSEKAELGAYSVLFFSGLILNLAVILLVLMKRVPRKNMHLFVANMAFADTLSLFTIPAFMVISLSHRASGKTFNLAINLRVFNFIAYTSLMASPVTLVIISMERLRAVSSSVQLSPLSRRTLLALIVFSWVVSGGVMSVSLVPSTDNPHGLVYIIISYTFLVIPVPIIVAINIVIIRRLVRSQANLNIPEAQQIRRRRVFRSAVGMILSSTLLYLVCALPRYATETALWTFVYGLVTGRAEFDIDVFSSLFVTVKITRVFNYANAAFGPLIYFVFLDDFRAVLRKLVCCINSVRAEEGIEMHRRNGDNPGP
ncbi:predicted protein [Nematostella vectensis]|uniref:G-protein coupled receptors family 1 profile domain-containing protein n=1 Tax=Nematostella vectensis TaxID=45351 RepID=A7S9Z9_NEMVE|nr:predicted protein [Nematostella vectensis]|eukprot:XP_001631537.1 predicted protein [Nematostella vectensis]